MNDIPAVWPAPAKLNLFLHVLGQREDGYHLLQTAFQFLDVFDELCFRVIAEPAVRLLTPTPGVPEADNLVVKAALALQQYSGCRQGVEIELIKHLPMGGGLGGGSTDAATTLLALKRLWAVELSDQALLALAAGLGADVPVFVGGRAAWAEGVGEILTPVDLVESWYLVLVPPVQVRTAAVFADPELTRNSPPITIRDFHAGRTGNDLEPVVRKRYPEVDAALNWLSGFGSARMTGSGACCFLPVPDRAAGEALLAQAPMAGFVARGMNRHPLSMGTRDE